MTFSSAVPKEINDTDWNKVGRLYECRFADYNTTTTSAYSSMRYFVCKVEFMYILFTFSTLSGNINSFPPATIKVSKAEDVEYLTETCSG